MVMRLVWHHGAETWALVPAPSTLWVRRCRARRHRQELCGGSCREATATIIIGGPQDCPHITLMLQVYAGLGNPGSIKQFRSQSCSGFSSWPALKGGHQP
jgi:hypothetical protein